MRNSAVVPAKAGTSIPITEIAKSEHPSRGPRLLGHRFRGDDSDGCCTTAGSFEGSTLPVAACPRLLGQIAPQSLAHLVGLLRRPGAKALAGFHTELAGPDLLLQERMRA